MSTTRRRRARRGAAALNGRVVAFACAMSLAAGCSAPAPLAVPVRTLLGYSPAASAAQFDLERRFQNGVSADSMSALHRPLTERPHPAGSEGTRQVVAYL